MRVGAIILAAGESNRFGGGNKLLAPIGGVPIIRLVANAVVDAKLEPVIAVVYPNAEKILATLNGLPIKLLINLDFADGMAASLTIGINALPQDVAGVMIMLADMPLVSAATLMTLLVSFRKARGTQIAYPTYAGQQGNPVIFPKHYFEEIASLKGDRGAKSLLKKYASICRAVPVESDSVLIDIDTAADYDRVCKRQETIG